MLLERFIFNHTQCRLASLDEMAEAALQEWVHTGDALEVDEVSLVQMVNRQDYECADVFPLPEANERARLG